MQEIRPGSTLSELPGGSFNEMQRRIKRLESLLLPRKRNRRGSVARFVAIVDDIDGASWDGSQVTEQDLTVYPFDGEAPSESGSFTVRVGLGVETPQTITAGKFKRGIILGDILLQVQCPEWDLPEGWGE